MSAIKQYIDLYDGNKSVINNMSVEPMNALREGARQVLNDVTLPKKGEENYEITDLDEMFAPDYGVNINRYDFGADPAEAFRCDVPNMSTWLYYTFNDTYYRSRTANIAQPDGLVIGSFREVEQKCPGMIAKYYGKVANLKDAQVALNTMLVQDGLMVYVPDNVTLEKPLQILNILNATVSLMVNRRVLMVVGENAHVKVLSCDHTQDKDNEFLNSQVIEIFAGKNSTIDFYDMEESTVKTHRVCSLWVKQEEGSNVLVNGITLVNGTTRNNYNISVDGKHCESHLYGMVIGSDKQQVDNHTFIGHNEGYCHSNELFKYILEDEAKGAFTGRILVTPNSPKIEAYQGNRNVCLSSTAKMYSKPQLEIYTDDVRCSHGSTIGQLDQDAIFYMQARGISKDEAKMLLMQAFMADVIDTVRLEALKDRLRHLVDKRLYGKLALCQECGTDCQDVLNSVK